MADRVVLVVYSGRPVVLGPALDHVDAVVAAWWPGSEAAGIADVLVGAVPWSGRLPLDWPAADHAPDAAGEDTPAPRWRCGHAHPVAS